MRNVSKNKFLLCFRPVLDIDDMLESKVSNKHEMKKSSETKSVFSHQVSTKFSRAIKAVVFETILKRRASHKTKPSQSLLSSSSSHSSASSSCSSPHVSDSESNSLTNKYCSTEEKQKESNNEGPLKKQKKFECNGIYFLILIILAFTVFWGKLFGIILTSMWLYFFSIGTQATKRGCQVVEDREYSLQAKGRGQFGRELSHNGH